MELVSCNLLLSRIYLCQDAVLTPELSSAQNGDLPFFFPVYNEGFDRYREQYNQNNAYIQNVGQIKLAKKEEQYALKTLSNETYDRIRKNLTSCFGVKANFTATVTSENVFVRIRPILHFFPNKVVNIIYSCHLKLPKEKMKDTIAALKRSLERGDPLPMKISKAYYSDIRNLKELNERICRNVEVSLIQYNFRKSLSTTHCFLDFPKQAYLSAEQASVEKDFQKTAEELFSFKFREGNEHNQILYSEDESAIYLLQRKYALSSPICQGKHAYSFWKFYAQVEYALICDLIMDFTESYRNELEKAYRNKKIKNFPFIKLNAEDAHNEFELLVKSFLVSFYYVSGHRRKCLYTVLGGKEKFMEKFQRCEKNLDVIYHVYDNITNPFLFFFKKARALRS